MPFKIDAGKAVHVEPGTYTGVLTSVEAKESGGFGGAGFRRWNFLVDVAGQAVELTGLSSFNTGPGSKAYEWLKAMLGRDLVVGEDIPDPIGTRVTLKVVDNKKGYSTVESLERFVEPQQVLPGVPR